MKRFGHRVIGAPSVERTHTALARSISHDDLAPLTRSKQAGRVSGKRQEGMRVWENSDVNARLVLRGRNQAGKRLAHEACGWFQPQPPID